MMTESQIQILIFIHAALGGLALCTGLIAMIAKKGSFLHRKSGKLFFYSLLAASFSALFISVLPNHSSPFLFVIGIFSAYLTIGGFRAISFKKKHPNLIFDTVLSWLMIATGIAMIVYPVLMYGKLSIVLSIFGAIGSLLAIQDLRAFKKKEALRKKWLNIHLSKMTGAYIASFTAFIVVNNFIPGVYGWLAPSFFGTIYIVYQSRKLTP